MWSYSKSFFLSLAVIVVMLTANNYFRPPADTVQVRWRHRTVIREQPILEQDDSLKMNSSIQLDGAQMVDSILAAPPQADVIPPRWRLRPDSRGFFFVYQPTGGWGNQRMILASAIAVANAMDRILVLPKIAPHSFLWHGYQRIPGKDMVNMAQVLNLELLSNAVNRGILVHNGTLLELQKLWKAKSWSIFEKPRYGKGGKWIKYSQRYIQSQWRPRRHFNDYIKAVAQKLMLEAVGNERYNAVHVRRGGGHTSSDRKTVQKYYSVHLASFNKSVPLYIATDEKQLSWFNPLKDEYKFRRLLFWTDLSTEIKARAIAQFPTAMAGDIAGFIEQIICSNAYKFGSSHASTFSAAISVIRRIERLRIFSRDSISSLNASSPRPMREESVNTTMIVQDDAPPTPETVAETDEFETRRSLTLI